MTETINQTCPAVGYQKVNVSVPVTVKPFAHTGEIRVKCCGHPVVHSACALPEASHYNDTCSFTITQTICVEVPVEFGADTEIDETIIECLEASAYDICKDCRHREDSDEQGE